MSEVHEGALVAIEDVYAIIEARAEPGEVDHAEDEALVAIVASGRAWPSGRPSTIVP